MSFSEITELLVPLDGREASARAAPVAARLADRLGLGLRLFGADCHRDAGIEQSIRSVADQLLPDREVAIDVAAADNPVDAIVTAAGSDALVCMATAASLRPHQGHLGSVAEGVARRLGRPMFLVGPDMEPGPGAHIARVIVPVDGSSLSEEALGVAGDLARTLGVPLWVVSVVARKTERAAEARLGPVHPAAEAGYVRRLAERLGESHGIDAEYEVLHWDDPAKALVDFAGDDGTVVMTTHGRSGLSRVAAGSVTMGVVANSRRAVLVWRPAEDD